MLAALECRQPDHNVIKTEYHPTLTGLCALSHDRRQSKTFVVYRLA
jgi:hypothetical protein